MSAPARRQTGRGRSPAGANRARPLATSHSSLASNGWNGARRTTAGSGERKEHLLQPGGGLAGLRAQLRQRADAADASFRQQHEAVANARGIAQLVNGE